MGWYDNAESKLKNKVLKDWKSNYEDDLTLYFKDGSSGRFYHSQECCESVLITSPDALLKNFDYFVGKVLSSYSEDYEEYPSETRTTQVFNFEGETLEIKWLGESNGYYSESVDFSYSEPDL